MEIRNAVLWHLILALTQPMYFAFRWIFNPEYFVTTSTTWLAFSFSLWVYIIVQQTIPFTKLLRYRHLVSPPGDIFPFGHAITFRDRTPPETIAKMCSEIPNDGYIATWSPFYFRIQLILTTPEACMEVINARSYDWEKPGPAKKLLSRVLGRGLVNVEGNEHRAMRKAVAPAFSNRQIRTLVPIFWSKGVAWSEVLAQTIKEEPNGEVEMGNQMSRATLDIIGLTGIGEDFDTIHSDENRLAKLYSIITSTNRGPILPFFLINVLIPPWIVRNMWGTVYSRVARATQELRTRIRDLSAQRKRDVEKNSAGHNDIIATITKSGDFSDEYLCDQLLTFFAAGHETTASALTWALHLLSQNQDMQDRLRKECQDHLSDLSPEDVTADTFDAMPYLGAVCNETLRLIPTVPTTARHARTDTRIADLPVAQGTLAIISPWISNRNVAQWGADAAVFRPERWLEGEGEGGSTGSASAGGALSPYAFLTFLHGPRSCIGRDFARLEMKALLAAAVLRFRFEPTDSSDAVEFGGFITVKPKGGLSLKVRDLRVG